jgi:hypothetical protein
MCGKLMLPNDMYLTAWSFLLILLPQRLMA